MGKNVLHQNPGCHNAVTLDSVYVGTPIFAESVLQVGHNVPAEDHLDFMLSEVRFERFIDS